MRERGVDWQYGELSAAVYELDKPVGRSLHGDIEFYTRKLAGVTGQVLEPAVGTGRMLIPLLAAGLDVVGYDTSTYMLDICRANLASAGRTAELSVADMLEYRRPGRFEAAILPTGSIILLPDREAVVTALGNLHDSLRPGGVLYVDVPAPRLSTDTGPLRRYRNGDSELLTLQNMHTDVDAAAQRVTTWLRYERWRDGRLTDTQLQIGGMLWFGMVEFTDLLRRAGFGDVTVYGDYGDDAPEAESGMWTFEARRAE